MRIKLRICLTAIFLVCATNLYAQNVTSARDVTDLSKIEVIRTTSYLGVIKQSQFCQIDSLLKTDIIESKLLQSSGFINFKFVEVSFREDDFFEFLINDNAVNTNLYMKFVLAYDLTNNRFYRLKGFLNNDFNIFLREVKSRYYLKYGKKLTKARLKKEYKIESVDLDCLVNNMRNINNWKKPCLKPAPSRLIITENGTYIVQ